MRKDAAAVFLFMLPLVLGVAVVPADAQLPVISYHTLKYTDPAGITHGIIVREEVDDAGSPPWQYVFQVNNSSNTAPPSGCDVVGFGPGWEIFEFGYTQPLGGGPIVVTGLGPLNKWVVSGEAGASPQPVWEDTSLVLTIGDGLVATGFVYLSDGPPDALYDAFVRAVNAAGEVVTATGTISGPQGNGFETHTATQGGWGAKPRGDNPGTVLHNNFATVYPGGAVVIGNPAPVVPPGYRITLTSAQAITDFLPTGSTPNVLTKDHLNPTKKTEAGVFAGQVLALQLNVDFSSAGVLPGGLAVWPLDAGPLSGMPAGNVLAAANVVLGGGPDSAAMLGILGLTVSQLNDVVTYINEKFDS